MEKIAEIINHYYEQIQGRVESILEETTNSKSFVPSQNIEAFDEWCTNLSGSNSERAIKCFAGLSAFFDAGVLMLEEQGRGIVQHLFYRGVLFPVNEERNLGVPLPDLQPLQIKRRPGEDLFEELFAKPSPEKGLDALLIGTPTPFVYLTFSSLPHPWLQERVEHLQSCLRHSFKRT